MLRWKTRPRKEGETYVILEGDLTEVESLAALHIDTDSVILNLARIRYINSEGSRRFLEFIRKLAADREITAELCSPAVVQLLNFVPLLATYLRIKSVIIPTECIICEEEGDVRVILPADGKLPKITYPKCKECGGSTKPAELEERYFAFLQTLRPD
jgi:hypothetical protein